MRQLMTSYKRPDVRKIAIFVTDCNSNADHKLTISEAEQAKREEIDIFVVGASDFLSYINEASLLRFSFLKYNGTFLGKHDYASSRFTVI